MQNPQTQKSELKTLKFGLWCFKNGERRLKRDKTRFKLLSSFRVGIKQLSYREEYCAYAV